ncbi:DivIVA domain-containing protein [Streptomyces fuscigenes]|uniref:DivIVA domain-containing protein n=1 Tax=Streptomyces fuscigenes TaxID=1528880 RepID=UPI001F207D07|nr:DivIVA domain-containing protein [Streptomyces fuscigenes]MCF3965301.1 DivIVA domain-containing protein [Streptomyces fuscigenes]
MFWFLLIAMVVVVAAVTLAVLGGGERAVLPETAPQRLVDPLPASRPLGRSDIDDVRLPVALRGYRMSDVDDVLGRLGAELAERDERISELESALASARAGGAPARRQPYGEQHYGERPYGEQTYTGQQPYREQGWDTGAYPPPGGGAQGEEGGR